MAMISGSLNPQRPFGRFLLTAKVASGGMATVYRAEVGENDPLHGKPLALKILHEHLSENSDFIRMFKDEGRIAQQFEHPNVVRVYEVGEVDGAHYLAMELVDGRDLAQLLVAHRLNRVTMPQGPTFEILRQALTALRYIHGYKSRNGRGLGIVHRDISPQNLLISRQPLIKLTDFGIARGAHRSDRTRTGTVKGKMHYMAPEQAAGVQVDARADLYALGAVAYEMLTGQPLFGPGTTEVLHERARTGQFEFSAKFGRLPEDVRNWLMKSLAPKAEDRFQSADAMLAAMERIHKASRTHYSPEALLGLLDLPDASRSKQRDQRLFLDQDIDSPSRARAREVAAEPLSALRPSQVGRTDLNLQARMDRLRNDRPDGRIAWDAPIAELKSVTGVREPMPRPSRPSRSDMLPAEVVVGKSYAPDDAASAKPRMSSPRLPVVDATTGLTGMTSASSEATRHRSAAKGQTLVASRKLTPDQKGLAMASIVAWSCGALVAFAVLLEVVGIQVQLPEMRDDMVASLWDEDEPAVARSDATAAASAEAIASASHDRVTSAKSPLQLDKARLVSKTVARQELPVEKAAPPSPVEIAARQAREERMAQRMVEDNAERAAWAGKPLETVEKPTPKFAEPKEKLEPVAKPAPVVKAEPVVKPEPAAKVADNAKVDASAKVVVASKPEAATKPETVAKAEPVAKPEPAAKSGPVAKPVQDEPLAQKTAPKSDAAEGRPTVAKPGSKAEVAPKSAVKPVTKVSGVAAVKPVAKPTAKVVAKPAVKATGKPIAKTAAKLVVKSAVKQATKAPAKPGAKSATKPVSKTNLKPAAKVTAKPVVKGQAKSTVKPAGRLAGKPIVKATAKPLAKATAKPVAKAATRPGAPAAVRVPKAAARPAGTR
ncbi:MAG: protein kinase domain-containing protein [Myxococcota bacterium]